MILRQVNSLYRFLFLVILSLVLMIIDHRSETLRSIRSVASMLAIPFHSLIELPSAVTQTIRSYYPDDSVYQELEALQQKQLKLESHLQRYDALVAENDRLSRLLTAARRSEDQVILASIVNAGLDPFSHRIIINRGAEAGVYIGQPVIAPNGVIGQVAEVNLRQSIVTLITDRSHGVPVQVQRNGLRTIAQGRGQQDQVGVPFLSRLTDIRKGDVLVTSGMGGRFPAGYKVAEVQEIITDANKAFLSINATTTAQIDFVKQVLLVWDRDQVNSR